MLARLAIGSVLASSSFAALLPTSPADSAPDALITPGPQIELLRKQNDLQYVGWVSDVSWSAETCGTGTYSQCIHEINLS
jgi:hypothetical protein